MIFKSALFVAFAAIGVTSRTIMIGDSILASDQHIQRWIEAHVHHSIENYAVIGASLHEGWVASIPEQYASVNKTPPIDVVILDGGGNDVMSHRNDCEAFDDACRLAIDEACDLAAHLMGQMKTDGIKHILYVGFYQIPGLEPVAEYGTEKLKEICQGSCIFVDLFNVTIPLAWDGMHPSDQGYDTIASEIVTSAHKNHLPLTRF